MKASETMRVFLACITTVALGSAAANGTVRISEAWANATAPTAQTGAAYFVAEQHGSNPARLIGAASPVAKRVELHTHSMKDGVMRMRKLDGIDVRSGEPLVFKPGGHHVMLMGLHQPLTAGTQFPLTLNFADGSATRVTVRVRALDAMQQGHGSMEHSKP